MTTPAELKLIREAVECVAPSFCDPEADDAYSRAKHDRAGFSVEFNHRTYVPGYNEAYAKGVDDGLFEDGVTMGDLLC